jgi:hypothetical protein
LPQKPTQREEMEEISVIFHAAALGRTDIIQVMRVLCVCGEKREEKPRSAREKRCSTTAQSLLRPTAAHAMWYLGWSLCCSD